MHAQIAVVQMHNPLLPTWMWSVIHLPIHAEWWTFDPS